MAVGARLAGPTLPKALLTELFPHIESDQQVFVDALLLPQGSAHRVQVVAFTKIFFQKVRQESRLHGWGSGRSMMMDAESTGALTAFAFLHSPEGPVSNVVAWVCRSPAEELEFESWAGPVNPRVALIRRPSEQSRSRAGQSAESFVAELLRGSKPRSGSEELWFLEHYDKAFSSDALPIQAGRGREWSDAVTGHLLAHAWSGRGVRFEADSAGSAFFTVDTPGTAREVPIMTVVRHRDAGGRILTLQQGASSDEIARLERSGAELLVPTAHASFFPAPCRPRLLMLSDYFKSTK